MKTPFIRVSLLFSLLIGQSAGQDEQIDCPPPGLDALFTFDFNSYISAPWYSVRQVPLTFQPPDELVCVQAQYTRRSRPWYCGFGIIDFCGDVVYINVQNYADNGRTDTGDDMAFLVAVARRPVSEPAKIVVGPSFIPEFLWGDYWVMAAGTDEDILDGVMGESNVYEWAIISGGPPNERSNGRCLPQRGENAFEGFWIFHRNPTPSNEVVEAIVMFAENLGYDTSGLLPVDHSDCEYPPDITA